MILDEIIEAEKAGRGHIVSEDEIRHLKTLICKRGLTARTKEDETLKENPATGLEREN